MNELWPLKYNYQKPEYLNKKINSTPVPTFSAAVTDMNQRSSIVECTIKPV